MGKKNCKNPDRVIDLYNGYKGIYSIYRIGEEGKYSVNGAQKNSRELIPFIERGVYRGATPRAKESLLEFCSSKKIRGLIKKLREINLSKLI